MYTPFDYDLDDEPPYELVEVERTGEHPLSETLRNRILIYTVHDGGVIPKHYRINANGEPLVDPHLLEERYVRERDWGANLVARKLAGALGTPGFARCKIARVLLDFNRFPGSSPPGMVAPLERLAINPPFSEVLDHDQKTELLERYYDHISDLIEERSLLHQIMLIGIHTYDELNPSLTKRPDLSIITQAAGYQRESRMPYGLFDPLYPDGLAESTCSRILRDRISLNLERNGLRVSHNHPYPLPEGSMEVRAQVWYFFYFVKKRFNLEFPDTRDAEAFTMVWDMLLNTNLRLQEGEALRSFLHRYRRMPRKKIKRYRAAQRAYDQISNFINNSTVVRDYQKSSERPSSLAIEVRKDLVCEFDARTGRPLPLSNQFEDRATLIGNVIAGAITTYFETDKQYL